MATEFKLATNVVPFCKVSDRFVPTGYKEGYEFEKQLELISMVEGISGIGYGWPCQFENASELKKTMENHGLKLAVLDTNIYTEPRFKHGSISHRDPKIRRAAIDISKATIDAAAEAGDVDVNLWPGHDGFEYAFEAHYQDAWKWIVESLQDIAEHNSTVSIGLEPKCKEPRANEFISNTGKGLMLANKINKPNFGITLDYGHSLGALENPAECATLSMMEGRLNQIHLNDNYRDWDHDLLPGTVTVWEHIEFFYWLRKLGYKSWYCLDIYPYREDDGVRVLECASKICHKCIKIADTLIEKNVELSLRNNEHFEIMLGLWDMMA